MTQCPICDYNTINYDPIMVISFPINNQSNNLNDLLDEYTSKKINNIPTEKWRCDKCKVPVNQIQKTMFWKLSPYIIILLKKYNNNLNKINKNIKYNNKIDFKDYTINYEKKSTTYSLESICIHDGNLNGGHYYAMCKNNNKWYIYNDTNVSLTDEENVLNQTPYILFYKRI